MYSFSVKFMLMGILIAGSCAQKLEKPKATVDLDDYIDNGSINNVKTEKKGDLSVSETGYYSPYQGLHGLHEHHEHHGHGHHYPIYAHSYHQPHGHGHAYGHHAHHHHHVPHHYGHAQTYFNGEYGGYGHLGSAHVSYGSDIHHGHPHLHHHRR